MMPYQILSVVLILFSLALAAFCVVLSRRLKKLNDLESGLGGAIAVMVHEVTRLEASIRAAKSEAEKTTKSLSEEVGRAKTERQYWQLQSQIVQHNLTSDRPRLRRRNRVREGSLNA